MDTLTALKTRRTIRLFQKDPVPAAQVEQWLKLLMRTPSAADARPWQFVIVDERAKLDALDRAMPKCDMLRTAPLAILIGAEPSREKIPGFWPQDCACAAENLLLAVHASGYGACWIGTYPVPDRERACRDTLRLPESMVPFALIAIGKAAEHPAPDDRYDATRIHRNGW